MGNNAKNSVAISDGRKRQLAALRPHAWPKGVSGNPGGRPKGVFRETALKHLLKRAKDGETGLDKLIAAQIKKAIRKANTQSAQFLRDTVAMVDRRPTKMLWPSTMTSN